MKKKYIGKGVGFKKKFNFHNFPPHLFDSHIEKSIPLFNEFHFLTQQVFKQFVSDDTCVYDLGCSAGKFLYSLSKISTHRNVRFIGIDNAKNMIDYAKKYNNSKKIEYFNKDIRNIKFKKSNLVICLFTLQFIQNKEDRQKVLNKIYLSLNKGGALVLAEKVHYVDRFYEEFVQRSYFTWKELNKFTKDEILHKSRLLKGVLSTLTTEENYKLLRKSGFGIYHLLLRHTVFDLYLAIK